MSNNIQYRGFIASYNELVSELIIPIKLMPLTETIFNAARRGPQQILQCRETGKVALAALRVRSETTTVPRNARSLQVERRAATFSHHLRMFYVANSGKFPFL